MVLGPKKGIGADELLSLFLSGRADTTLDAYRRDLEAFRAWMGAAGMPEALERLLGGGAGTSNQLVLSWRADLIAGGLKPATINRRLSAVRSVVRLAATLGIVSWRLEVPGLPSQPYRDTAGPGPTVVRDMLAASAGRDLRDLRNVAILRLLHDLGLRRAEVASLDRGHVDVKRGCVWVLGKRQRQRQAVTVPEPTMEALQAWMGALPAKDGPLFVSLDRAHRSRGARRLTAMGIYRSVRRLARAVGARSTAHGIRHTAITAALEATGGDVRAVQRFARHGSPKTTMIYDDARRDIAGDVARKVAEGLEVESDE